MNELEEILAKHKKVRWVNLGEMCADDCPACAQRRLAEWLKHRKFGVNYRLVAGVPIVEILIPEEEWEDLCQKVV